MQRRSWTRRACVFLTAVVVLAACKDREQRAATEAELAELDRGVGLMGKFEFDAAQQLFARLAEKYPRWFEARFNMAVARLNRQGEGDEGRAEEALQLFERAAEIDPGLRSAHYAAAQALGRLGRERDAQARMEEFNRQGSNPLSRLAEFKYTRMGPKSEALPASRKAEVTRAPPGPLFAAAVPLLSPGQRRPGVASAADIDGDGAVDLFIPGGRGAPGTVLLRSDAALRAQPDHPLAKFAGVEFAAWGDVDNDGLTDVLLCRS
jgi:hypothetical protein